MFCFSLKVFVLLRYDLIDRKNTPQENSLNNVQYSYLGVTLIDTTVIVLYKLS